MSMFSPNDPTALTVRVQVAKAKLNQWERPDLANIIEMGVNGDPICRTALSLSPEDRMEIWRATKEGHIADPEGVPVFCVENILDWPATVDPKRGFMQACETCAFEICHGGPAWADDLDSRA